MKSILVLFALAFGGPVLMAATLIDPNAAATIRDVAAWVLMLMGIGVTGLALRMERKGEAAAHTMRVLRPSQ